MNQSSFVTALSEFNITLSETQLKQLNRYYELLIEYNKVMNLTNITKQDEVYLKHFYDSLTICKVIDLNEVETLCDIGTGAGFPGLVLKIVFPHLKVTLIDSLQKRIKFLNVVIQELELKDIVTIHSRVEEYGIKNRELFDVVTARALAATNILLEFASPLVKVNGFFIPLKGKVEAEANYNNALDKLDMQLVECETFYLPIEESNRTILKFKKNKITNRKYPRKFSDIKRKAL